MSAGGTATSAVVPGLAAIGHPSSSARLQAQLGGSACGCSTGIQTQARFGDDAGSRDVGLGVVGGSQRSRRFLWWGGARRWAGAGGDSVS